MPRKNVKEDTPELPLDEKQIGVLASAYSNAKMQQGLYEKVIKEARPKLERYLEKHKTVDANGNQYVVVSHQGVDFVIEKTSRKTTEEKVDAIEIIKRKHPRLKHLLIETVEVLREDKLSELLLKGKLEEDEIKELVDVKEGFAFSVKIKK